MPAQGRGAVDPMVEPSDATTRVERGSLTSCRQQSKAKEEAGGKSSKSHTLTLPPQKARTGPLCITLESAAVKYLYKVLYLFYIALPPFRRVSDGAAPWPRIFLRQCLNSTVESPYFGFSSASTGAATSRQRSGRREGDDGVSKVVRRHQLYQSTKGRVERTPPRIDERLEWFCSTDGAERVPPASSGSTRNSRWRQLPCRNRQWRGTAQ